MGRAGTSSTCDEETDKDELEEGDRHKEEREGDAVAVDAVVAGVDAEARVEAEHTFEQAELRERQRLQTERAIADRLAANQREAGAEHEFLQEQDPDVDLPIDDPEPKPVPPD